MRFGRVIGAAVLAMGVGLAGTGIGQAEPTAAPEALALRGVDKGMNYQVSATDDRRAVVTSIDTGRFQLVHDAKVVAITDDSGTVLAALPMVVRVGEHSVPLEPTIDADGSRLTLTPVGESETPVRDISAQERFFAETQRLQPEIIQGAAIGAAIGFVLGFPLGLFVLDFITVPVATVAGAAIGALAGYAMAGGQPAIDTAVAYVTGAP
jgi:tetrahydromethanopterin S-methyltransferase subunit F